MAQPIIGIIAAIASPVLWGFAPIYFKYLVNYPLMQVMAQRALWAGILFLLVVFLIRGWERVGLLLAQKREMQILMFCALLVGLNWSAYLYAVFTDRIAQSALGYFIYPLLVIAMGVAILKEQFGRRTQIALILAFIGVAIKASVLGDIPWLALFIGITFAVYALIRKQMRGTDALTGMVIEMFLLAPIALIYISYLVSHGEPFFFDGGMIAVLFAISSGFVTATPLLLFHIGNRYLPLTLTGFLFYINPSMQLASAVWFYGEPISVISLLAFCFIWAALIVQFVRLPLRKR